MNAFLAVLALLVPPAAPSPPAAAAPPAAPVGTAPSTGGWLVYGGDFDVRSAVGAGSIRREGPIARTQEVVVGRREPLKADGRRPFDYVVMDVEFNCDAQSYRATRATFYDRTGSVLWSTSFDRPFQPVHPMGVTHEFLTSTCRGGEITGSLWRAASLAEMFGETIWWKKDKAAPAPPR